MGRLLSYIKHGFQEAANLDNRSASRFHSERKQGMGLNEKKIRRKVVINGQVRWITADTEQEYADKLMRMTAISANQTKPKSIRFEDYAENWLRVFCIPNVEKVTANAYKSQLRAHVYPIIGTMDMDSIGVASVQEVFNRMAGLSQQTKNKVKNVMGQIFKMAAEDGVIAKNPMDSPRLKIHGKASVETEPYSVMQMQYFAAHIGKIEREYDRAWLALAISLPLRPEEVLGIKWKDLNLHERILHVRGTVTHPQRSYPEYKAYTKTESSARDLSIPSKVLQFLPEPGDSEDFVIGGKNPLSYTSVRHMRVRIAKQIDFDGQITPRRFRTTVATDISDMTHDLKLVQRMLGHSTPQMTLKHYDKGRRTSADATDAIERCYGLVD